MHPSITSKARYDCATPPVSFVMLNVCWFLSLKRSFFWQMRVYIDRYHGQMCVYIDHYHGQMRVYTDNVMCTFIIPGVVRCNAMNNVHADVHCKIKLKSIKNILYSS